MLDYLKGREHAVEALTRAPESLAISIITYGEVKRLIESLDDATFRILAKQDREEKLLTWVHVSRLGGTRALINRFDRQSEVEFRAYVAEFEADAFSSRSVYPPAVVALDEWRENAQRTQSDSPPTP